MAATISLCYAGCGTAATACYTAAGFVFGTVPGSVITSIPTLAQCNAIFAACETACVTAAEVETVATVGLFGLASAALPATAAIGVGYLLHRLFWKGE